MALCHNCDDVRDLYTGNGVQKEYKVNFTYNKQSDVSVANWNEEEMVWEEVSSTAWAWKDATVIRFNDPPANGQKFIIYRCTDLNDDFAEFYPGTAIKAGELNDNFFVIKAAIEENRCAINRQSEKSEEKYWDKVNDIYDYEDQTTGVAIDPTDDKIFTAKAIAARSDAYVQETTPGVLPYEQKGKIWYDTGDLREYFWDSDSGTWVSFSRSGPSGPAGPAGPAGKVIVSDNPPTSYPVAGTNTTRPLESGDLWFDSYRVMLYTYYIDTNSAQWVSVSKTGPQGPQGANGGIPEAPNDNAIYGRQNLGWVDITDQLGGGGGNQNNYVFTKPLVATVSGNTTTVKYDISSLPTA